MYNPDGAVDRSAAPPLSIVEECSQGIGFPFLGVLGYVSGVLQDTCNTDQVFMTYQTLNNHDAAFNARYKIDVFAPPDLVWDWLTRVDLWANWRQDVTSSYWVSGKGERGTLKWRLSKLLGFTATVDVWREEQEMRWGAVCYRTHIEHVLRIDGDHKRTIIELEVIGDGGVLRLYPFSILFKRRVNRSNEIWLGALKTKLEAGKDESLSPPGRLKNPFENNVRLPSERDHLDR